jgi:hypothetical protein
MLPLRAQGHVAYHQTDNPIPKLRAQWTGFPGKLDDGNDHFNPSTLAVTTFDVGNPGNVVPAMPRKFNIATALNRLQSLRRLVDHPGRDGKNELWSEMDVNS